MGRKRGGAGGARGGAVASGRGAGPSASNAAAQAQKAAAEQALIDAKKKEQGAMKLPMREDDLFKSVQKAFENKQFEKAMLQADKILERFPYHGETLAMKGLAVINLDTDRRDEALALIKQGLGLNIRSSVCWHILGLFYRLERNFVEACKAYRNALEMKPVNTQILRDLPGLEIQCRDFSKLPNTRRKLLEQQPHKEGAWLGYVVALTLSGKPMNANRVLTTFLDNYLRSLDVIPPEKKDQQFDKYQISELFMYKANLFVRAGQHQQALDFLLANQERITDKYGIRLLMINILLQLERTKAAENLVHQLIQMNPENLDFHELLCKTKGVSPPFAPAVLEEMIAYYDRLAADFPREEVPRRQPLEWIPASDDRFRTRLDAFLRNKLTKGVPSLFKSIASLLTDPQKRQIIGELAKGYLELLEAPEPSPLLPPNPVTFVWTLAFLAQYYDYVYQPSLALHFIDRAIEHTPTVLEFYVYKSKIFEHQGDAVQAAELYDFARQLDLADRHINTRTVKRMLRINDPIKANALIALFTREGDPPQNYLYDMQCVWFELETADAYLRVLNLGRALKKYVASYTHFHDFIFDQMDFHDYCPRRSQLNSYLRMIQHCDVVRNHPQFLRAVRGILQCYALLYDQQQGRAFLPIPLKREATPPKPTPPTLPVKSQPPAAGAAARTGKPKKKYGKILHPVEKDPDGLSLLVEDPLAKAETYIDESFPFNKNDLAFQLAAFEIYIRLDASRFLLALRCLKRAAALDAQHAGLHFALCRLWRAVLNTPADALPPVVRHVLSSELAALLSQSLGAAAPATPPATLENMASLGEHNLQYHAAHPASLPHTLAVARVINLLEPTQTAAFLQDHLITIHPAPSVHSLKEMTEAYLALRSPADLNQPQLLANLCVKAHELYPYAPLFRPLP